MDIIKDIGIVIKGKMNLPHSNLQYDDCSVDLIICLNLLHTFNKRKRWRKRERERRNESEIMSYRQEKKKERDRKKRDRQ